jgi:6-phosphogluconate dehydrogenase (decarboxylating)
VSGGVGGAAAGTLTFMVGGPELALARARPYLEVMGGNNSVIELLFILFYYYWNIDSLARL